MLWTGSSTPPPPLGHDLALSCCLAPCPVQVGTTALMIAAASRKFVIVQLLLDRGAHINAADTVCRFLTGGGGVSFTLQ
jgi:hypothetical protein